MVRAVADPVVAGIAGVVFAGLESAAGRVGVDPVGGVAAVVRSAEGPRPQHFASPEASESAHDCRVVHPLRPGTGRGPCVAASPRCALRGRGGSPPVS